MSGFDALIEFVAKEDQESYFALMTYRNDDMTGAAPCATTFHNGAHLLCRSQLQVPCRGSQGKRRPSKLAGMILN
jgi:hypothetical protein